MTRILITGFSGFVGRHFLNYLEEEQNGSEVLGVARSAPDFPVDSYRHIQCGFRRIDMLEPTAVQDVIRRFRPRYVLHLAANSSVGFSWKNPIESFSNNTNVFLNLLEGVREVGLDCRILSVGSSEEYGDVHPDQLPLREDARLTPVSPYAVARVAQEMLSSVYVRGYQLDLVMTRSFNHIGTYQRDVFVVPSIAKQLTAVRYRNARPHLTTGDRSIVRDFVDVRDVVRAYFQLLRHGQTGQVYNVCSGRGVSIETLIAIMQELLGTNVELHTDARLVRPNDNREVIGSGDKIREATGWEPQWSLQASLERIVEWWSRQ